MRILIVKLHALGDLIIATPAIRRLKMGMPNAEIDLLTTDWTAPAAENNPLIDNIIKTSNDVFFKPGLHTISKTLRLITKIKKNRYNAAIFFHANRGIDYLLRPSGIKTRFMFSSKLHGDAVYLDPNRHSALTACELADYAVFKLTNKKLPAPEFNSIRYEWYFSDEEISRAKYILKSVNIAKDNFMAIFPGGGINPGAFDTVRRWKASRFAELIYRIHDKYGFKPLLMGGKSDRQVCEEVARISDVDCVNLSGSYGLRLSAAILKNCQVAVSNDSGPLHIAAAVGAPVVGIFGPTGPKLKLPPGKNVREASIGIPCSPCYFGKFKGCIFDSVKCFEDLTSELVMKSVNSLLETQLLEAK